ncbi:MAG: glycosyltransferase family 4 protein [Planctomycetota bacterium]|jgi:glycosyltransferase involved in cell wall biosynthesis
MHIGLIVDEERLLHEHVLLNRLAIGMIDHGAKLTRFVPDRPRIQGFDDLEERVALIATRVDVPMRIPGWLRAARTRRLVAALERSVPDVLYAVGTRAWPVALDLAAAIERPVALDIWSAGQLRFVPRGRAAHVVSAYVAPTEPVARLLRERVEPELVSVIPPGVAIPPDPTPILREPDELIALAIVGSGRDVPAYTSMLAGLSRVVREMPQIQACIELRGPRAHAIWREARRLELLGNLSAIRDAAPLRTLLTGCDALLMPERFGEIRSLVLEAMASTMTIIAARDPYLEMLVDGETACSITEDTPEAWARSMQRLFGDPEQARRLGRGARDLVVERYRSTDHVRLLMGVLERVVGGDSYSFAEASREGQGERV